MLGVLRQQTSKNIAEGSSVFYISCHDWRNATLFTVVLTVQCMVMVWFRDIMVGKNCDFDYEDNNGMMVIMMIIIGW